MSDVIEFNGVRIGDAGRLLVPQVEALGHGAEPMLWATFAGLDDSSRNWIYRIQAAVLITRNTDWKVIQYVGSLRAALGGLKADLVWKTGATARVTWPNARLDLIRPPKRIEQLRSGIEANVILEFRSACAPT